MCVRDDATEIQVGASKRSQLNKLDKWSKDVDDV